MAKDDQIPNQNNYQDSQNFDIDIDKIYSDFVTEIDANRSIVNIQVNQSILKVLDIKTIASLNAQLKVESTPQESRAHAFYRLIGFPVIGSDNNYYNPGLDTVQPDKLSDKITIANHPLQGFQTISLQRENYVNSILNIFAVRPATITATALSLTSSTHTRSFAIPVTSSSDPFDFSLNNQSFTADFRSVIGKNDQVLLVNYVDQFGNSPLANADGSVPPGSDSNPLLRNRFHIIKPFIVDPRIDFSVNPASRRVSVPFVPNKSNLLVGEDTYVKRPLLEKVIRDRLTVQNQNNSLGTAGQSFSNYILNVPSVKDEDLIKQMANNDAYRLGDQLQFLKYFNIIRAMINKLVEAQLFIQKVQAKYYWLPLPSSTGPEGGSDINGIIISQSLPDGDNNSFITTADRDIINLTLRQAANQFNAQTAPVNGTPDLGGFVFDAFKTTFDQDTSQALGDRAAAKLTELNGKRNHSIKLANNYLRTIEIIMGEFSGLGLCDIIAVMAALYIMPVNDLLGFLDDAAFTRMKTAMQLQDMVGSGTTSPQVVKSDITTAHTSFISKVKDFYNLMDKIYQDIAQKQGLSI